MRKTKTLKKTKHNTSTLLGLPILTPREEKAIIGDEFNELGNANVYDIITQKIIEAMDDDGLFWRKPFKPPFGLFASNFVSKQAYTGMNFILLNFLTQKPNPYWLTFNQIKKLKGKIKKGAKGEMVLYFSMKYKDDEGNWLTQAEVSVMTKEQRKKVFRIPVLRYYKVFNGEDVEGIDFKLDQLPKPKVKPIESAQKIIDEINPAPDIRYKDADEAFYARGGDYVQVPPLTWYDEEQKYYSVLFHELAHWTGAPHRLNRVKGTMFGDERYAFEELIAEIGAAYLCGQAGILYFTLNNSAAYIKGWKKAVTERLKEDNKAIFKAASQAQKAVEFLLGNLSNEEIEEARNQNKEIQSRTVKVINKLKEALGRQKRA